MNTGFKHHKIGELEYLTIPAFDDTKVVTHCFTTKLGGVSTQQYSTLNLAFNKTDIKENVVKNYKIITRSIGLEYNNLVFSTQVHDDRIADITLADRGKSVFSGEDKAGVDGLITNEPNVPLITFYADCVPLFFLDPVKKVIALAHSGWRGTVKKLGSKMIMKMMNEYGCCTDHILTAIGPSIGQCHFEVDEPVVHEFYQSYKNDAKQFIEYRDNGKYYIDLWQANILQFMQIGIPDKNITLAHECTYCNKHMYFSHRGDHGKTGSLAAIIMLKDD